MIRKRILAGVLGVALVGGGAAASKVMSPGDGPLKRLLMGRMGRAMELRSELNLSADQKEAIKASLQSHKKELAAAIEPVAARKRALRVAVLADSTDEKVIHAAAEDLGKALGDAAVVVAKVKTDVKANAKLTDEQMKLLKDFREKNDSAADKFLHEAIEK